MLGMPIARMLDSRQTWHVELDGREEKYWLAVDARCAS